MESRVTNMTTAEEEGSAALLARLDASLLQQAAHSAMDEELLTLHTKLQSAVQTLASVRSMTAALTRVEQLRSERFRGESSALQDVERLCESLGVCMDALVGEMAVEESPPPQKEEEKSSWHGEPEPSPRGLVEEAPPAREEDSPPPSPLIDSTSGEFPTDESAETEDEYDPKEDTEMEKEQLHCELAESEIASLLETLSESLVEEEKGDADLEVVLPSTKLSETTFPVYEQKESENDSTLADDPFVAADSKEESELLMDGSNQVISPPSTAKDLQVEAESVPLENSNTHDIESKVSVQKGATLENAGDTQVEPLFQGTVPDAEICSAISQNGSPEQKATGAAISVSQETTVVKIDRTNSLTFARTCLDRVTQVYKLTKYDLPTLDELSQLIAQLLKTVERKHQAQVATNGPLLDGEFMIWSVAATGLLVQIFLYYTPKTLELVPLFQRIRHRLLRSSHPQLQNIIPSEQVEMIAASILFSVLPKAFHPEFQSSPSSKRLLWNTLVLLTTDLSTEQYGKQLRMWTLFFETELRRSGKQSHQQQGTRPKYPLPLVFLVLAIVIHVVITKIVKTGHDITAFKSSLLESSTMYRGKDILIQIYAVKMARWNKDDTEPLPFDFRNEPKYIQAKLAWVYERRRIRNHNRKRTREE